VMWLPDEPRVGVAAVVDGPYGEMTVATTHLSFVPGWNAVQLRTLCRELTRLPGPRVLLGDLNLPGGLPARLTGWQSLARVPTYPTGEPRVQLDHVLSNDLARPVLAVEAPALAVSDHRALLVEL
jgi:endonuclease/exonuclease/phosphatase family metal-dependent hydrolase